MAFTSQDNDLLSVRLSPRRGVEKYYIYTKQEDFAAKERKYFVLIR